MIDPRPNAFGPYESRMIPFARSAITRRQAASSDDADPEGPISSAVRIFCCYTKTALPVRG